nr:hypothetical protein [Tanacetum cinerariifolium]
VKKLERLNKVKSSKLRRLKKVGTFQRVESSKDVETVFNQGRISVDMETDEGIELEKAAKRRKLSEEAQEADDLRGRLEIVQDEDDDVFVEAISLAQKVPVVDYQDAIWRNQKSVHGLALVKRWKLLTSCGVHVIILSTVQLFLLVERRYPLFRFTLEQLVNVAKLQVEEKSGMSLELLRFTRQQLLEYQQR